jgi:HAD superfamily hydrolase (TIGR01509 family)
MATELKAIAGAAAAIAMFQARGVGVCVASSTPLRGLRTNLQHVGLFDLLDPAIFSASQVKRSKPAPDVFLHAAAQMGFDPAQCVVVEDSVAGVTAARRAHMRVVGFTGAGHAYPEMGKKLLEAGASSVFSSMTEIPDHVG